MISSRRPALTLAAHLAAFTICVCVAFARNLAELFYAFDGSYAFVETRNQFALPHPLFAFSNTFLQSIGNIQLTENARLLAFFWPIAWFSNIDAAKVGVYALIAAIVFLSTYATARILVQPQNVALGAAWIVGLLVTPVVPLPFFYPILAVAPASVVLVAAPVVVLWLLNLAGRSSILSDVFSAAGLLLLTAYILAACPTLVTLILPGVAVVFVLALVLARGWAEALRKIAVTAAVLAAAILLRWPWYVLGLLSDSAPYLWPNDYSVIYQSSIYVSVFFQNVILGWSGPAFVVLSALGAGVSLRSPVRELRAAAFVLLAIFVAIVTTGYAMLSDPHWILPPPIYLEIAAWPLYGMFSVIALQRFATTVAQHTGVAFRSTAAWAAPLSLGIVAVLFVALRPSTASGYPFPPAEPPIVKSLRTWIGLSPNARFSGRVATIIPLSADGGDAWLQQYGLALNLASTIGNDEMSLGLWYFQVPTLFEYNALTSPGFHTLIRRTLLRPPLKYQRNITIESVADVRVLKLLGVRYVLAPSPVGVAGKVRMTQSAAGKRWSLVDIGPPNLATYSPTLVVVRPDFTSTYDVVANPAFDLATSAVALQSVGPLVSVESSNLSMAGNDLHLVAASPGRSLIVVPLEYSRCLDLDDRRTAFSTPAPYLLRVDGNLTGVVFEKGLDAVLAFRIGPFHNAFCRWEDYREARAMATSPANGAL